MKRCIVFIIAFIMMLQISVPVLATGSAQQTSYTLLTHWDFEGVNSAARLTDKASGGNTADTLVRNAPDGNYIHLDGSVATVDAVGGEYLSVGVSDASSDLYDMTNKTIIIKAKLENSGARSSIAGIAGKKGAFELGVATSDITKTYTYYNNGDKNFYADSTQTVPFGEANDNYRVYVLSFESTVDTEDKERVVTKTYVSTSSNPQSASDFILYSEATSDNAKNFERSSLANAQSFILGKRPTDLDTNRRLKISFDDVKIFSGMLTLEQVVNECPRPNTDTPPDNTDTDTDTPQNKSATTCAYTVEDKFTAYFQSDDTNYVTVAGNSWTNTAADGAMNEKALKCVTKGTAVSDNGAYLTFPVPSDGEYYVWARMSYGSVDNNSLFYQIDGEGESIWDFYDEDNGADCYGSWHYVLLTERASGSYTDETKYGEETIQNGEWRHAPKVLTLTEGEHTVKLVGREDGMLIDEFVVTSYAPSEYDPNAFEGNTSVMSACKYCGSGVKHYYSDLYAHDGSTAQGYFVGTLHTDAVAYTLPKVTLPAINVAQTVPPVKFDTSGTSESDTADVSAETESDSSEEEGGCGSAIGASSALVLCCAALTAVKRKKKSR